VSVASTLLPAFKPHKGRGKGGRAVREKLLAIGTAANRITGSAGLAREHRPRTHAAFLGYANSKGIGHPEGITFYSMKLVRTMSRGAQNFGMRTSKRPGRRVLAANSC
jgi:hypothetical protein